MLDKCSAGFILATKLGWLICHVTNSGGRWDLPKGRVDEGEDHFAAAQRELLEEAGIILPPEILKHAIDLGQHAFRNDRDLHLYYVWLDELDTTKLACSSMVDSKRGDFPEVDAAAIRHPWEVIRLVGASLAIWLDANVPTNLSSTNPPEEVRMARMIAGASPMIPKYGTVSPVARPLLNDPRGFENSYNSVVIESHGYST